MTRWSHLKQRVEGMFADSVCRRVELRMTRFRRGVEDAGTAWIAVDKKPVVEFDYCRASLAECSLEFDLQKINRTAPDGTSDWYERYLRDNRAARDLRMQQGLFTWFEFCEAMQDYLSMRIEDILGSGNPMVRAVGFLDRRVGKRRLRETELRTDELPMVTRLFEFRCEAEHIDARHRRSVGRLKAGRGPGSEAGR